jgi:hypothetical protein
MTFLNKSVNYSQTTLLKSSILAPLLKNYNEFLLQSKGDTVVLNQDVNTGISYDYIIPNNNKKYYLLVTKKSQLEQTNTNTNYNILYFFPDSYESNLVKHEKSITDESSKDFYLEIDNTFKNDFLFEGYLYKQDDKYEYLLTDILIKNKDIINVSYELRLTLLNEILLEITREKLKQLNNHMTINIHPIFDMENENFVSIFKKNFIYKNEICSIERISKFKKTRYIDQAFVYKTTIKNITTTNYTDVYNVYDYTSNNFQGILYIKGISESKHIKELFKQNKILHLECSYNTKFSKWQPVF